MGFQCMGEAFWGKIIRVSNGKISPVYYYERRGVILDFSMVFPDASSLS